MMRSPYPDNLFNLLIGIDWSEMYSRQWTKQSEQSNSLSQATVAPTPPSGVIARTHGSATAPPPAEFLNQMELPCLQSYEAYNIKVCGSMKCADYTQATLDVRDFFCTASLSII